MRYFLLSLSMVLMLSSLQAAPPIKQRDNLRNARYGEVVLVTGSLLNLTGHVYNTIGLNTCPEYDWELLNPEKIKKQFKARTVILNGPRYFMMDSCTIQNPHPDKIASFGGLKARWVADLKVSLFTFLQGGKNPYTENKVLRTTKYTFKKGLPIYELTSPKGQVYVMQSYSRMVNPKLKEADLRTLGSHLPMPKGWTYRMRKPKKDYVMTANKVAYVLQDALKNSYQRAN